MTLADCIAVLNEKRANELKLYVRAAESYANNNMKNPKIKPYNMTVDQIASIHIYTQEPIGIIPLYKSMNAVLRAEKRTAIKEYYPYIKLLLSALHLLPTSVEPLTVFRGCEFDQLTYEIF